MNVFSRAMIAAIALVMVLGTLAGCQSPPKETERPSGETATPVATGPTSSLSFTATPTPGVTPYLPQPVSEVTLQKAGDLIGSPIPMPGYLPEGFSLRRIFVWAGTAHLFFSDKDLPQKVESQYEVFGLSHLAPLTLEVMKIGSRDFFSPLARHESTFTKVRAVDMGELEGEFQQFPSGLYLFVSYPGLTITLKTPYKISEEESIKVAQSIPVVVQPYFGKALAVSSDEAAAAIGTDLPLPRYLPKGYELKRIITLTDWPGVAFLLFSDRELTDRIDNVADVYRIWDNIWKGTTPVIMVKLLYPSSPWAENQPEVDVQFHGGSVVDLGKTKALMHGVSYYLLNWRYPGPQGGSLFDTWLIAPEKLPNEDVIQLAKSMLY